MRLAARAAVRPVAWGLAGLYAVFAVAHLLVQGAPVAAVMVPTALVSSLIYAGIGLGAGAWPIWQRGQRALLAMATLALANSVLHLALVGDPVLSTNIDLVFLGSGAFLFARGHLGWILGAGVLGWLAVAAADGFAHALWVHFGVGLASAGVLSALVFAARNRFIRRLALLEVQARARELRVASSEARYRHLFDASPAMICVHDLRGNVLDANRTGAKAVGVAREAVVGRNIGDYLLNGPLGAHLPYLADLARDGSASGIARVVGQGGRIRLLRYESTLFDDPAGGRYAVATGQDVTELEEAREELEAARDRLEEEVSARTADLRELADRLAAELREREVMQARLLEQHRLEGLGRLAGGVAHEFNNILAVIRGNAELAAEELDAGVSVAEHLRDINEAVGRGASVVARILDFSEPGSQGHVLFDLEAVLVETVALLRDAMPPNVRLDLSVGSGLGNVLGSPGQIRQAVVNLVANARQAVERDGGWIRVRAAAEAGVGPGGVAEGTRRVRVEVLDNGPGIPPEHLGRVFDPFFTTRGVGEGHGLGLSVVHGVVRGHGGDVRVECPPEGGTRVVMELPTSAPERRDASRSRDEAPGLREAVGPVLVVDDEPAILRMVQRCLERRRYRVLTAPDVGAALAMLRPGSEPIALLVTDLHMPDVRGDVLVGRVRALHPDLPALVLTGSDAEPDPRALGGSGPTRVLRKPFGASDLLAAVDALLERAPR